MEGVALDNRTHMAAINKEYQEIVNQLVTVSRLSATVVVYHISQLSTCVFEIRSDIFLWGDTIVTDGGLEAQRHNSHGDGRSSLP